MTIFEKKVYNMVRKIPRGKVLTYQNVARAIKKPRAARAVGNALNKNCFRCVPCHRVIRADGRIGEFNKGGDMKIFLLRGEGIGVKNGKTKLSKYQWKKTPFLK